MHGCTLLSAYYLKAVLLKKELFIICCTVVFPVILFGGIVYCIGANHIVSIDNEILKTFHMYSSPLFDSLAVLFSNLGYTWGVLPLDVVIALYLLYRKQQSKAYFFILSVTGASLLSTATKLVVQRPRPDVWETIVSEHNFSFPSGHAMGIMALGLALIHLMWNTRYRVPIIIVSCSCIVFVCMSRLYLGVHYPSDVLAGILASLAWVMLLHHVFMYQAKR